MGPVGPSVTVLAATENGDYFHDLLTKLGLNDFGARTVEALVWRPLKIVLILVAATVLSRLAARWIAKSVRSLHLRAPLLGASARAEQRATTICDVLSSAARVVIWAIAVLIVFDLLDINLAPLLAGAGIAGIALGFGAQSVVKDVISGLFILIEDQYGVGDVVDLGDTVGTVEEVNLRVTRLRSVDGEVWFVPNGEVRKVGNASLGWNRAVVDVPLPITGGLASTIERVRGEVKALCAEDRWRDVVDGEPEVWGVEALTADTATVRISVRTQPQQQAALARAMRERLAGLVLRPKY